METETFCFENSQGDLIIQIPILKSGEIIKVTW